LEIDTYEEDKNYSKDLNNLKRKEFFDHYALKIRALRILPNSNSSYVGEEFMEGYKKAVLRIKEFGIITPDTNFLPL
jgi:hypothetical protein